MRTFICTEKYFVKGRGLVYTTKNPERCEDFQWLLGERVIIQDQLGSFVGRVLGVESFAIAPKPVGMDIGLLIE